MTRMRSVTDVRQVHQGILAGSSVTARQVVVNGAPVHVAETGDGPPLVMLHGTAGSSLFLLPLLERIAGARAMAADRPGHGLSGAAALPPRRFRQAAVSWVDHLLDALGLDIAALLGHSMGGLWATWYALAHPERVDRLLLVGAAPTLPGTRCPLPIRLIATPGLGEALQRWAPPTPKSMLRFAHFMGEGDTLAGHPELIDLLVAIGRDPVTAGFDRAEIRAIVSPFALVARSGFRRRMRLAPDELRQLAMPVLLVWGDHEPVGSVAVATTIADLIPDARLEILPTGHAPWLGHPDRTAALVADFLRNGARLRRGYGSAPDENKEAQP